MVALLNRKNFIRLAVLIAASIGAFTSANSGFAAPISQSSKVDVAKLMEPNKLKDMTEGDSNAPVTIVEYASLTCGHCADFAKETMPFIREKYIKTGKVYYIFREFAFDPRATAGFMLARCAPEDRYFPMVDVLFAKQMDWAAPADALTPLKQIAKLGGFTDQSFEACLKNQTILQGVNASLERGKELGVTATPTFFINGDKYEGAMSVDEISTVIDKYLNR